MQKRIQRQNQNINKNKHMHMGNFHPKVESLTFLHSNHFILVRVAQRGSYTETQGLRQEYTVDGTSVHH